MIDYAKILETHFNNFSWQLVGENYEGLEWYSNSPKPTKSELDALWDSTQSIVAVSLQSAANNKASAISKLIALGLTEDEIKALIN